MALQVLNGGLIDVPILLYASASAWTVRKTESTGFGAASSMHHLYWLGVSAMFNALYCGFTAQTAPGHSPQLVSSHFSLYPFPWSVFLNDKEKPRNKVAVLQRLAVYTFPRPATTVSHNTLVST